MQKTVESRGLRLLSLDGGGIRGLSELFILEEIMNRIKHCEKLDNVPRPCDYFDLIGGAGTGGLIALMLGKLQMPVTDVITAYVDLAQRVFSRKKVWGNQDSIFRAADLEAAIQTIIKSTNIDVDARMRDSTPTTCRSVVCAVPAMSMSAPRLFRTYEVKANQSYNCTIWEAARATSATPKLFKPIAIGDRGLEESFLGADLKWNNPVTLLVEEAKALSGPTHKLACVVSIGSGHPDIISWQSTGGFQKLLSSELLDVFKQICMDCEDTAQQFEKSYDHMVDEYFRFSVEQGMQKVSLVDWEKLGEIRTHTMQYLQQSEISKKIDAVANVLCNCLVNVIPGELDKSPLAINQNSAISLLFIPPPPTTVFLGREDILSQMSDCFMPGHTKQCRFVLYGLGGAGKTQIALKFVEQHQNWFSTIYFIDSSTVAGMETFYKAIAQEANMSDITAKNGMIWMAKMKKNWLLIFDNADDPRINLYDFFPACNHGNIIITSRNSECRTHAPKNHYEVAEIGHDSAIELLLMTSGVTSTDENLEVGSRLVNELGHLALAIVQAGAYILQNPELGLQKYLESYRKNRKRYHTLNLGQTLDGYTIPVYTTWEINHAALSDEAAKFLQICAFLHHTGISESLFEDACWELMISEKQGDNLELAREFLANFLDEEEWDDFKFRGMIRKLSLFSLVQTSGRGVYAIHPLVHSWAKQRETQEVQKKAHECASEILYCVGRKRLNEEDYKQYWELIPHLDKIQETYGPLKINMAEILGFVYFSVGRYTDAERLEVQVLNSCKEVLGEAHSDTLTSMANLAVTYKKQGMLTDAEKLQVQVLELSKKAFGEAHPDTLASMANLAVTYSDQGRFVDAEILETEVLKSRKEVLEEAHPNILSSMTNLAATYSEQGRLTDAEKLQVQVFESSKKVLGENHPDTLSSMANLAITYQNQGRYADAEKLQIQVFGLSKDVFGETHPDTLTCMANLAVTYRSQGKWANAEGLQIQVLEARKKGLGLTHPDTLSSMTNLAVIYKSKGRYTDAERLQIEILELSRKVLGEMHPDTLTIMANLAVTYKSKGRFADAEKLQLQVLEARKIGFGLSHPDTLSSMANLAVIYSHQEKLAAAEALQVHTIQLRKNVLGESHPDTLTSMSHLAITYTYQKRWPDAEKLQVQVLELRKEVLGVAHPDILTSMSQLAVTYLEQGRLTDAEMLEVQVLESSKEIVGDLHPVTLRSMANLARIYKDQGKLLDAEQLAVKVIKLRMEILGEAHPYTLDSIANLAAIYSHEGKFADAEKLQVQVLESRKKVLGEIHSHTLMSMTNLAITYSHQGKLADAEKLEAQIHELHKKRSV